MTLDLRADFPVLSRRIGGQPLIYFDSGATSQKPRSVIKAVQSFYESGCANIHRGVHLLSMEATEHYEGVRSHVARFIGAENSSEIVFTRGTTEAVNLIAESWGRINVCKGDAIAITRMEHHSNFVPWQVLAKKVGADLLIIELTSEGRLDLDHLKLLLKRKPKLLAVTLVSNVLGTVNPIQEIAALCNAAGTKVLVDAAQAMSHMPVRIPDLGPVDFLAFSGHKMHGPSGIGVLWSKLKTLEAMPPYQFGGDMILEVKDDNTTWNDLPWKFEAGTPNIEGVIGLGAAIDYLEKIGFKAIEAHESALSHAALERLAEIKGLRLLGPSTLEARSGVFSFLLDGVHPHDLGTFLDSKGIAVRAGHHCAQPLHRKLGLSASTRVTLGVFNTITELDALRDGIKEAQHFFGKGGSKR